MGWAAMLRTEPYTGPTDTVELVDEFLSDCRWRGCAPKPQSTEDMTVSAY